jgi:hypothetical protein
MESTTPQKARPEYLAPRKDENPSAWTVGAGVPLIASVFANAKLGQLIAPTEPTPLGRLLRTYALVQARYDTNQPEQVCAQFHCKAKDLEIARVWWAQHLTNKALGLTREAWLDGTGTAIAEQVGLVPIEQAISGALPHLMTQQARAILRKIGETSKEGVKVLQDLRNDASEYMAEYMNYPNTEQSDYESDGKALFRRDEQRLAKLANIITQARHDYERATDEHAQSKGEDGDAQEGSQTPDQFGGKLAPQFGEGSAWYPINLGRVNLTRKHEGKIGVKRTASDSGRTIRYPSRALTDPARRVFGTKARNRNALIVLDMSGSMDYSEDELDEIIEFARGAVVVGYSGDGESQPNCYVLAKDGHRVEDLPDMDGSNGCDGSAFQFAVDKYRKSGVTPVIWVSDGDISGTANYSTQSLARDMIDKLRANRGTHCLTSREAIGLMEKMALGHKIQPQIHARLYQLARVATPAHAVEATRRANAN